MYANDQPTPIKLFKQLATRRNLIPNHQIQTHLDEDIAKSSSGYYGELSIDFHLKYILEKIPKLSNLRMKSEFIHFEIDTLLFCVKFLLLLQVKNLAGEVTIDHRTGIMNQKVRNDEVGYQDPILQVEKHARLLTKWLKSRGYDIPIETLVVFTNKNVMIQQGPIPLDPRIVSGYKLSHAYYDLKTKYKDKPDIQNRLKLYRDLQRHNEMYDMNLLKELNLSKKDFIPGAFCNYCHTKSMQYRRNGFECNNCKYKSQTVLEEFLKDYYLIFGHEITSDTLSEWLKIDLVTSRRLLAKQNFRTKGRNPKHTF
ncbi:NERD domain-containing protein [Piscibacillus salipiscarius]|uniref:NERD domain-containing protein n=1 Tax=Piscibacillus salipiscarius TaxID=299480 RepID=UPI0006D19EF3|nr:NERD domain-containing protein [Piscibacillus salipiscarius]